MISQKLSYRIIRHVLLFVTMVTLFSWVTHSRSGEHETFFGSFISVFTNALFFFGYAYLTVYLFIPYFLVKRKVLIFIALIVVSGIGLSLLKFIFSDVIFYQAIAPESTLPDAGETVL